MKRKKTLMIIPVFVMLCSLILTSFIPVFADGEIVSPPMVIDTTEVATKDAIIREEPKSEISEAELKATLTVVKKAIAFDEKLYSVFNYNTYNDYETNELCWRLNWQTADYSSSINVTVTANGVIKSYNKYLNENYKVPGFAKIAKVQAQTNAETFVKKIIGVEFSKYTLSSNYIGFYNSEYFLSYNIKKDGYFTNLYPINIGVNKYNGEITSYEFGKIYNADDYSYDSAANIIGIDKAKKAFADKIGVKLIYTSYYDYNTKKLNVFAAYQRNTNVKSPYISALDGSLVEYKADGATNYYGDAVSEAEAASDQRSAKGVTFSEAENAAMADLSKYIKKEEALAIFYKILGSSEKDFEKYDKNVNLMKPYYSINKDCYIWNIELRYSDEYYYDYMSAHIDARNGNIISFNINPNALYTKEFAPDYQRKEEDIKYTYENAKEIVLKKLPEYLAYDISNFKLIDEDIKPNYKAYNYNFNFTRVVNGLDFVSNGLYLRFNSITGTITTYDLNWYEEALFPKLDNIITAEAASYKMLEYGKHDIFYMANGNDKNGKSVMNLVYTFLTSDYIDPFTGKYIGYDGKEVLNNVIIEPDYSDVKGHWSEKYVKTLLDNGLYAWGGKFEADKAITKDEFYRYMEYILNGNIIPYQYNFSEIIYKSKNPQYISDEEKNDTFTKEEASQIICELLSYDKLGEKVDFFKYPYKNDTATAKYKGYITICNMLGLMNGDKDGNFDAMKNFTRADTAYLIYAIISNEIK